jgi:hypothetical protein
MERFSLLDISKKILLKEEIKKFLEQQKEEEMLREMFKIQEKRKQYMEKYFLPYLNSGGTKGRTTSEASGALEEFWNDSNLWDDESFWSDL